MLSDFNGAMPAPDFAVASQLERRPHMSHHAKLYELPEILGDELHAIVRDRQGVASGYCCRDNSPKIRHQRNLSPQSFEQ